MSHIEGPRTAVVPIASARTTNRRSSGELTLAAIAGITLVAFAWEGMDDVATDLTGWGLPQINTLVTLTLGITLICLFYFGGRVLRWANPFQLSRTERRLLAEIDEGVRNGEFVPYFQPIYDMRLGRIVAAEALARWVDRSGRVRQPNEFIPLMERTGRLHRITGGMLSGAAEAVRRCEAAGRRIDVSVNVSAQDFENSDLVREIEDICRNEGIPPERLKVELTETQSLQRIELAQEVARSLRARGVRLVLDDFGTGYAALHVLDLLPFSEVKLDRAFIAGIENDPRTMAVVRASIELAAAIGAEAVAEGVEDASTAARLRDMGIQLMQGYHFGRPMPLPDLLRWVSGPKMRIAS